jgi:hypothetical protein
MIKGVNRQMIEILDTGNPYFERAFLVVQADIADVSTDTLQRQAKDLLKQADGCSHLRRARYKTLLSRVILALVSALLGAGIALFFSRI